MGFYRKKPVEVEAHKFEGSSTNIGQIRNWIENGVWKETEIHTRDFRTMEIETLEGTMTANPGDYIIKGVEGEFYPCKPDIFHATYEAIDTSDRLSGEYLGKDIRSGDVIDYCGKHYTVHKATQLGDDVELLLNDGTRMGVRATATLTVVKVG